MTLIDIKLRPGINKDQTSYSVDGGWVDGDKIRFQSGFPQKIGGWEKITEFHFDGVCRQMFRWVTTFAENFLAIGTNNKLYIERSRSLYDITPLRDTRTSSDTDNCLSLEDGSNSILVTLSGHGARATDYIVISGVAEEPGGSGSLYGIPLSEINATLQVTQVIDTNNFRVLVNTPANTGGAPAPLVGGTSIDMDFYIHSGREATLPGYGWGTMTWGRGAWGSESTQAVQLTQQDWWFDKFYNDLIANIRMGPIFYWARGSGTQPDTALGDRAVLLSSLPNAKDVPDTVMQSMVSQDDGHLIAFGCTPYGQGSGIDPLLIRWASQDDPVDWEPRQTNSSGFLRISRGQRIMRAMSTRQEILVWTESSLSALQYLGTTDVFGLQTYAENISLIAPRALATARDTIYWMGHGQFYTFTGRVEPLQCTLQDYVFSDINLGQTDQVFCTTNEAFHELWWFYPSKDSDTVNRYVVFNYLEGVWYHGSMSRTAWLDSPEVDHPQGTCYDGYLYDHEVGADAAGKPMKSFIRSSDIAMDTGDSFILTHRVIPDMYFHGSTANKPEVTLSILPKNFPGGHFVGDPFDNASVRSSAVDVYTEQLFIRARGRHLAMKIESDKAGVKWQLGTPRIDVKPSGRR